ncbi:hypothetical protein CDIK_4193 [Cucumispora dikerogammari]|nr:hypothetical protein CDIK_4193 [Cucumispora dikerogammari]
MKKSFSKFMISYNSIEYKKYLFMGRVSGLGRRFSLFNEEKKVLVKEIHKNLKISANKLKNMGRDSFGKSLINQTIRNTLNSGGPVFRQGSSNSFICRNSTKKRAQHKIFKTCFFFEEFFLIIRKSKEEKLYFKTTTGLIYKIM